MVESSLYMSKHTGWSNSLWCNLLGGWGNNRLFLFLDLVGFLTLLALKETDDVGWGATGSGSALVGLCGLTLSWSLIFGLNALLWGFFGCLCGWDDGGGSYGACRGNVSVLTAQRE